MRLSIRFSGFALAALAMALTAGTTSAQSLEWQQTNIPNASVSDYWQVASNGPVALAGSWSGLYRSVDSGKNWVQVEGLIASRTIYSVLFGNGAWYILADKPHQLAGWIDLYKSTNDGLTWDTIGTTGYGYLASNSQGVFLGGTGLYTLTDTGFDWGSNHIGLASDIRMTQLLAMDGVVIVGIDSNDRYSLLISTDGCETLIPRALPTDGNSVVCTDRTTLLAANNTGVYRSHDTAQTWVRISDDTSVTQLKLSGQLVLIASKLSGPRFSSDQGATWVEANRGLPYTAVAAITLDKRQFFVSLLGGGIYRATFPASLAVPDGPVLREAPGVSIFPNPTTTVTSLRYKLGQPAVVRITVIDGLGRTLIGGSAGEWQSEGGHEFTLDLSSYPNGIYTCVVTHGGAPECVKVIVAR